MVVKDYAIFSARRKLADIRPKGGKKMRKYEIMFIVRSDAAEEDR